jgi:hypothetical protein
MVMRDFHGWDAPALWEDIKWDAKHFNQVERVAMVGDKKWQEWMAAFCRPFTTGKVRYFDRNLTARAWLTAIETLLRALRANSAAVAARAARSRNSRGVSKNHLGRWVACACARHGSSLR